MIKKAALYLVPTPIGNLKDITLRALEILQSADVVYAEDTRKSSLLLHHHNIKQKLSSYHKFNEKSRCQEIISLIQSGKDVAIISDAGSPGISDPSDIIVQAAIEQNITVIALPGATALIPALTASGLSSKRFYFIGFLPAKNSECRDLLDSIKDVRDTLIFYEAPHRIKDFLQTLKHSFSGRKICVARELTKMYETYYYGLLEDFLEERVSLEIKGEFVVLVEGCPITEFSDEDIIALLQKHNQEPDLVRFISTTYKLPKNRVYKLYIQTK